MLFYTLSNKQEEISKEKKERLPAACFRCIWFWIFLYCLSFLLFFKIFSTFVCRKVCWVSVSSSAASSFVVFYCWMHLLPCAGVTGGSLRVWWLATWKLLCLILSTHALTYTHECIHLYRCTPYMFTRLFVFVYTALALCRSVVVGWSILGSYSNPWSLAFQNLALTQTTDDKLAAADFQL